MLGKSLPPVPAQLVARIQKGEYMDMADLLRYNIKSQLNPHFMRPHLWHSKGEE